MSGWRARHSEASRKAGRGLADDIGENRTQGGGGGGMPSSAAKMAALHVAVVAEGILVLPTTFAEASTSAKASTSAEATVD